MLARSHVKRPLKTLETPKPFILPLDCPHSTLTLQNGIRLLVLENEFDVFRLECIILGGQDLERRQDLQLSHLCEHLLARFTSSKYPSQKQTGHLLAHVGVEYNAMVNGEVCRFEMTGLSQHLDLALDILISMYLQPAIDESIVSNEFFAVHEELVGAMKKKHHPLDIAVLTTLFRYFPFRVTSWKEKMENLKNLSLPMLRKWIQTHFLPERTCFIISSSRASLSQILPTVLARLEEKQRSPEWEDKLTRCYEERLQLSREARPKTFPYVQHINCRDRLQARFVFVFPVDFTEFDLAKVGALHAWLRILAGADMNSRLIKVLRSKLGAVYAVHHFDMLHPLYKEDSFFGIDLTCVRPKAAAVLRALLHVVEEIRRNGLTWGEYKRFQNEVKYKFANNQVIPNQARYKEQVLKLSKKDIDENCRKYLDLSRCYLFLQCCI